ncbi:uncharacterized protein LOC6531364 [Drosophila yakuba]|uniref:TIL domain-containing protein n=1 Tax=Drosophila yakuba TaxID=7245 RepID=B4P5W3_DROYA|nr:uncharacterized protein LOC6531364 [Drosophila yakuba]EDW91879.2 uncharacterized protein Dyak_GE11814 [Drosophila yakuba]
MMACRKVYFVVQLIGLILHELKAEETTEAPITWPDDIDDGTSESELTWPNELPVTETNAMTYRTARTLDPMDALRDDEEFMEKPHRKRFNEFDSHENKYRISNPIGEEIALKRKPLPEEQYIKQPFLFGCCHNSTNVRCAGVCPETCEYRSKYCVPLCGPPCRCKRGYVYNIPQRGCTLRSDCPKGIVQSKNGIYRVFL